MHRLGGKRVIERSSIHEYLHNSVRDPVDRLGFRLGRVSRGRWPDPHSADRGADFPSAALYSWATGGLNRVAGPGRGEPAVNIGRPQSGRV
jgi:hypothetical protein